MKRIVQACLASVIVFGLAFCVSQRKTAPAKGWVQLFNGKDLQDWDIKIRGHALNENYGNTFRVVDGNLQVSYDSYTDWNDTYGHIFHKQKFSSYLLVMEYRFIGEQIKNGPGWAHRNNGAMLHSQSAASMGLQQDFPISLEAQLLGGNGTDARSTGNLCTPGTHVEMDGKLFTPHCVNSTSKTYHGDQWVTAEVLVLGDSLIKHIVMGDTVLTYAKPRIGGGNVSNYSPDAYKEGQPLTEGYIAFQSESHPTEFRKIELYDLKPYVKNPKALKRVLSDLQNRNTSL